MTYKLIKYYLLFLLTFSLVQVSFSQVNGGARHIALAGADEANNNDIFSLFNNPSGTAQISKSSFGLYYSPFPYGLKELANGNFAFLQPTNFGNFSLGFSTFGFDLFKENKFFIGYSNKILENFLIGFTSYLQNTTIKRYGSSNQLNVTLGGLFILSPSYSVGFSLHNPLRYSNSDYNQQLIYNLGISYFPNYLSSVNFSLNKEIDFPISLRCGVEYQIIKYLCLRIGTHSKPNCYSGGIGINYSFFTINYGVSSHQELGLTHQFDLITRIN